MHLTGRNDKIRKMFHMQVETKEEIADNISDTSKGNDADKDDKTDVHADPVVKTESVKASSGTGAPSIQEPLFKTEKKDEETIHDSDFEEPSGLMIHKQFQMSSDF